MIARALPGGRDVLARAKARLDRLDLHPTPVRTRGVRILVVPWLFRLPWFRRFDGYATWTAILLRSTSLGDDEDLIVHELCHVWQMQHHPVRMPLSYVRLGYAANPHEAQARAAVAATQAPAPAPVGPASPGGAGS
jgi:hypothetical protein